MEESLSDMHTEEQSGIAIKDWDPKSGVHAQVCVPLEQISVWRTGCIGLAVDANTAPSLYTSLC